MNNKQTNNKMCRRILIIVLSAKVRCKSSCRCE